jgi:hypothetical protein
MKERKILVRAWSQHTGNVGLGSTTGVADVANNACNSWAREVATGASFADGKSMGAASLKINNNKKKPHTLTQS